MGQALAQRLAVEVKGKGYEVEVIDMKDYDPEDRLSHEVSDYILQPATVHVCQCSP